MSQPNIILELTTSDNAEELISSLSAVCLICNHNSSDIKSIINIARKNDIPCLVKNEIASADKHGFDGIYFDNYNEEELGGIIKDLKKQLGQDFFIGVDCGFERHVAMVMGEAGADFIAFGKASDSKDADVEAEKLEHIKWWNELFTVQSAIFGSIGKNINSYIDSDADFIIISPDTCDLNEIKNAL